MLHRWSLSRLINCFLEDNNWGQHHINSNRKPYICTCSLKVERNLDDNMQYEFFFNFRITYRTGCKIIYTSTSIYCQRKILETAYEGQLLFIHRISLLQKTLRTLSLEPKISNYEMGASVIFNDTIITREKHLMQ